MHNNIFFGLFDEKNEVESATGLLYGCYFSLYIMPIPTALGIIFSWEIIIKASGGLVLAFITAICLNLAKRWSNDFYDKKISPRWGKPNKVELIQEDNKENAA